MIVGKVQFKRNYKIDECHITKAQGYVRILQIELTLPEGLVNSTSRKFKLKSKSKEQNGMEKLGMAKETKF